MTTTELDAIPEHAPELPPHAQRHFLGLGVVGVFVMTSALVSYGVFGAQITAGLDQACAEAAIDAGRKLEANGNTAQAIQKYRQALAGNISDERERIRCGLAIGDILFRAQRYEEALTAYSELPPGAFDTAGAFAGFVGALWNSGNEAQAEKVAQEWLDLAVQEGNGEQEIWARTILMRAAEKREDLEAAMAQCRGIVAVDPVHTANLDLARFLQRSGDRDGARAHLEAYIALCEDGSQKRAAREVLESLSSESVSPS